MRSIFAILVSIILSVEISGAEEGPKFKIWINSGSDSKSALIAGLLTRALSKIPDVLIVPRDDSDVRIGVVAVFDHVESINYFWKRNELKQNIDETVRGWDTGAFQEYRLGSLNKWYEMDKVVRQKFPHATALYDL